MGRDSRTDVVMLSGGGQGSIVTTVEELAAAARVAAEVRVFTERLVSTDPDLATLDSAGELVARAAAILDGPPRPYAEPSRLDEVMPPGLRAHGLLVGPAHPLAPPIALSWDGDRVVGQLRLTRVYEGPRGFSHGGVSALILDEVTAKVRPLLGTGRVTRTLALRYRRPVPVDTDLVVTAELISRKGREATSTGSIALASAPTNALVVAETNFVLLGDAADGTRLGL